jgi:non-specific serine/threonine protein kinase
VCGGGDPAAGEVLDLLGRLVDKSLVRQEAAPEGGPVPGEVRFGMLETVRAYARERLRESGDEAACRRRHAAYYLALVERTAPSIGGSSLGGERGGGGAGGQADRGERLARAHDDLRAALGWWEARAREGEVGPGLRLAGALWPFWFARGYWEEGRGWLQRFLALDGGAATPARAVALFGAGYPPWNVASPARAQALHEEHLALCRALGDQRGVAWALLTAAHLASWRDDREPARAHAEASLALAGAVGDHGVAAWALVFLGWHALRRGDVGQAEASGHESLRRGRASLPEGARAAPHARLLLAESALRRGDAARAAAHYAEGLRLVEREGEPVAQGRVLRRLGHFALQRGDLPGAVTHLRAALARLRDVGALEHAPACLVGLAGVAMAQHPGERAARLCGAATAALAAQFGRTRPIDGIDRADFERIVAAVRATLATPAVGAAWAQGHALPLDQAIVEALTDEAPPAARPRGDAPGEPLTPREREVAALVAAGLSNREIAARLVITERTAENHVAHILDRLGFRTRVQIAAWATARGLTPQPA